jgi:hypothetical protein
MAKDLPQDFIAAARSTFAPSSPRLNSLQNFRKSAEYARVD